MMLPSVVEFMYQPPLALVSVSVSSRIHVEQSATGDSRVGCTLRLRGVDKTTHLHDHNNNNNKSSPHHLWREVQVDEEKWLREVMWWFTGPQYGIPVLLRITAYGDVSLIHQVEALIEFKKEITTTTTSSTSSPLLSLQVELTVESISATAPLKEIITNDTVTTIKSLIVKNAPRLTSIKELGMLKELNTVILSTTSVSSLAPLLSLSSLTSLTMTDNEGYSFSTTTNNNNTTFTTLHGMYSLTELDLSFTGIESLLPLTSATMLETLDVHRCNYLLSLDGIDTFSRLKTLNISQTGITVLTPLRKCTTLEVFNASECEPIQSLENGIESLSLLHTLNISQTSVSSLLPLKTLYSLESLNLFACPAISSLKGLESLTALKRLDLSSTAVESLNPLRALSLVELNVCQCRPSLLLLSSLDGLQACAHSRSSLRVLKASQSSLESLPSLSLLFPFLETFCASACALTLLPLQSAGGGGGAVISELRTWQYLREVNLSWTTVSSWAGVDDEVNNNNDPIPFPFLEVLDLSHCSLFTSLDGIEKCTALKQLNVADTAVHTLDPLGALGYTLERLDVSRCKQLLPNALCGIKKLSRLRELILCGVSSWSCCSSLDALASCTALETLDLSFFQFNDVNEDLYWVSTLCRLKTLLLAYTNITSLAFLARHPSLEELSVHGCASLHRLDELKGLSRLRRITAHGTAVRGVQEIENCPLLREDEIYYRRS